MSPRQSAHRRKQLSRLAFVCCATSAAAGLQAEDYQRPPINYSQAAPNNRVSALQEKMDAGQFELTYRGQQGYLSDVLRGLEAPVESQSLVFSRTSLQLRRISPRTPRAIYFNDDVYVGYCQGGEVLEIAAADPQLGAVFYTVTQDETERPRFQRRVENCLVCHSSTRTESVPGHLIRSLYVDSGGTPIQSSGARIVDHTTPLEERWGGWYVTGTHGAQKHLGNLTIEGRSVPQPVDNSAGQNLLSLDERFLVDRYLTGHSDIVALMVLEHQALAHNRLTRVSYVTRQALAYEKSINKMLGKPPGARLESTTRRIRSATDDLVESLLFVGEAKLTASIAGTSGFAEVFSQAGPRDAAGRSLRDLDLQTRLLRHPCSYLVYSDAFLGLPAEAKTPIWEKMWDVLSGADTSDDYAHLSEKDRRAIVEIPAGDTSRAA